jgi:hypothetical protein
MADRIRGRLKHLLDILRFFYYQQTCLGRLVLLSSPVLALLCLAGPVLMLVVPTEREQVNKQVPTPTMARVWRPTRTPYPVSTSQSTHTLCTASRR